MSDPAYDGTTFDLGADANAPRDANGNKLASADIAVRDSTGEIVAHVEVNVSNDSIRGATGLRRGISHAQEKATKRAASGEGLTGDVEAFVVADVDPIMFVDEHGNGTRVERFVEWLNSPGNTRFPDVDRVTIFDQGTGVVEIQFEKVDGEWVNVFD